ncbi:MAG: porin, partial [Neisseriaceae bacterium]|nr:porin [Neisseriaceae bacterium]
LGNQWESSEGALTFAYNFGNIVPRISYAYGEEKERHVKDASKNKFDQIIVGVDYNLSKRTAVLASLGYWSNKPKSWVEIRDQTTDHFRSDSDKKYERDEERQEAYSFGLGLRHKF